jgi:chromosomal replication initiation ATPase DnaA
MAEPPRQLVLDLGHAPSRLREDFVVTPANRAAFAFLEAGSEWPAPELVLVGPPGSGKSHLAEIWRVSAHALVLPTLQRDALSAVPAGTAVLIEDLDRALPDEVALFHALNLVRELRLTLLVTARTPPRDWAVVLPDLASRLRALPTIELQPPDELLLAAVIAKQFADRQLAIDAGVVAYLAARMERSLAAAQALVARLDHLSLAEGRRVTKALAARALASADEELPPP